MASWSDLDGSNNEDSDNDNLCLMVDKREVSDYHSKEENFEMQNAYKDIYRSLKDTTKQYPKERRKVEALRMEENEMMKKQVELNAEFSK